jgi:putative ABC transport system permease protein
MLRNYLTVAIRNLVKHRLYSAINIGGLAVGLAACLLILLFVRDELSYDEWLPNAERIAKLEATFTVPGRAAMDSGQAPGPAKSALEKDFSSDVERVVRIFDREQPLRAGDRKFADEVNYVDAGFFQVFDLPMVEGDREAALSSNTRLLMSERTAKKYFGEGSPIGKVVTVDNKIDYTVAGVFRDLPANTHLKLDVIALFDRQRYIDRPSVAETWTSANAHVYVMFRSPEGMSRVEADMPGFIDRNVDFKIPGFEKSRDFLAFEFMPLLDIHLHARKHGYFKPGGDIAAVVAFSAIALMILVIACINFVNLATARSMKRAREVAMRKVVGATRSQLIGQHLGEAILTATVALVIAIAIAEVALGPYNAFLSKELALDFLADPILIAIAAGLVAVVGVLGGLYPAVYLSRFRPARVLKANQSSASGSPRFRNALVVFQFAISIGLIVCTAVVYGQTIYARNIELGFESSDKLVVESLEDMPSPELLITFRKEVNALPGVRGAALASDKPPLEGNNNTILYRSPTGFNPATSKDGDRLLVEMLAVDFDFFDVYGVKPLAGRVFSREFPTDVVHVPEDKTREATESIVVNETFLAKAGLARPEDAVGMVLWDVVDPGPSGNIDRLARTTIIGVVPDMHLRSVRDEITPLLYIVSEDAKQFGALTVDVEPGRMREVHTAIGAIWQRLAPATPIRTGFMDDDIAAQYDAEEQRAQIFAAFSMFAVLIACLGLFGLASFAAERRTKEIGLRKVMGASVLDIVRLLVWQFSKPVLVANLIAWPVAFYFMNRWLSNFRYAIDLVSPLVLFGVFGGAGLIALAIAWSTVAGHASRVARSSPIHALRCE